MKRTRFMTGLAALGLSIPVGKAAARAMDVQISIPDDDGIGLKGTVPVTATAHPLSNLRYLRLLIDSQVVAEDTSSPLLYSWDTTKASDGTHILQAIAQYKTRKSTAQIAVTVNNSAPPPPPPPPTALGHGVGYIKLGSSDHPPSNADKYDLAMFGATGFPWTYANRAISYVSPTNVNSVWDSGIPYAVARDNGWLLKDSGGNYIYNRGYPENGCGDVGDPGYRDAWCRNVEANHVRALSGCSGFYGDDVIGFGGMWWNAPPAKYPDRTSWDNAMVGFVEYAYNYFKTKSIYVGWNCGDFDASKSEETNTGVTKMRFWNRVGPHADGLMAEYWMFLKEWGWGARKTGPEWYNNWDSYRNLHKLTNGQAISVSGGTLQLPRPIDFIGLDYGAIADRAAQRYIFATFLLDYNEPGSVFVWAPTDGSDPWYSDYDTAVGGALGAATQNGTIWKRDFEKAIVTVDSSLGTATIAFKAGFASAAMAPVSTKTDLTSRTRPKKHWTKRPV